MPSTAINLGHAIQLALAPVFMLSGIAGLVAVMANRLSRIVDRDRQLTEMRMEPPQAIAPHLRRELASLDRRRHLASAALTACTLSALLVCTVVTALFIEELLELDLKWLPGIFFAASTSTLVVGLACFLREVHLATATVRIETEFQPRRPRVGLHATRASDADRRRAATRRRLSRR